MKQAAYQPEIGQALFGNPYSEYNVPAIGEAAIATVLNEMERVYGNRYGRNNRAFSGFGHNDGFVLSDGALGPDISYRSYLWGDCICDENADCTCEVSKPNLSFDGVEIRWYKHARRGVTCNKNLSPEEWSQWLIKAITYLQAQDVKF